MKNKAFTLTELLVVVVIIGTLSAVVLPKFTKVIETRRTGEAEEIMSAVRTEQEARCTLDKTYTAKAQNLHSLEGVNGAEFAYGKNYKFTLNDTGMTAARKGKDYQLKMKSYADGGLCCEGNYCEKLNKSYPACNEYNPTVLSGCAVPPSGEENQVLGGGITTCDETLHYEGEVAEKTDCACGGPRIVKYTCNQATYNWDTYVAQDCKPVSECQSPCDKTPYDDYNGCPAGYTGYIHYDVNASKCEYVPTEHCSCNVPAQTTKTQSCGCDGTGVKTLTFDTQTCKWNTEWSPCSKEEENCGCDPDGSKRAACVPEKVEGNKQYLYTYNEDTCECVESCVYGWASHQVVGDFYATGTADEIFSSTQFKDYCVSNNQYAPLWAYKVVHGT